MKDYRPAWTAKGVTLIELMIVVVVMAIMGVVAIPAYRGYAQRAQRTEATSALLRLAANQERFYLQNNTYSNDPGALGFAGNLSDSGLYTLQVVSPAGDLTIDYRLTAIPAPGSPMSADADCASFTIDSQGIRTSAPNPIDECWGGR